MKRSLFSTLLHFYAYGLHISHYCALKPGTLIDITEVVAESSVVTVISNNSKEIFGTKIALRVNITNIVIISFKTGI